MLQAIELKKKQKKKKNNLIPNKEYASFEKLQETRLKEKQNRAKKKLFLTLKSVIFKGCEESGSFKT